MKPIIDRLAADLGDRGIVLNQLRNEDFDSLDMVELVMQVEDITGMDIPDEDAERIRSVGDGLHYLLGRLL